MIVSSSHDYVMWQSHVFGFFFVWFTVSKSPVCRVEVAGLPCRNHRFTVSKSPVCRVKVAGLSCRNHQFAVSKSPVYRVEIAAGLLCQSRRFTMSKWPSYRFAVSKSPAKKKVLNFNENKKK